MLPSPAPTLSPLSPSPSRPRSSTLVMHCIPILMPIDMAVLTLRHRPRATPHRRLRSKHMLSYDASCHGNEIGGLLVRWYKIVMPDLVSQPTLARLNPPKHVPSSLLGPRFASFVSAKKSQALRAYGSFWLNSNCHGPNPYLTVLERGSVGERKRFLFELPDIGQTSPCRMRACSSTPLEPNHRRLLNLE